MDKPVVKMVVGPIAQLSEEAPHQLVDRAAPDAEMSRGLRRASREKARMPDRKCASLVTSPSMRTRSAMPAMS